MFQIKHNQIKTQFFIFYTQRNQLFIITVCFFIIFQSILTMLHG